MTVPPVKCGATLRGPESQNPHPSRKARRIGTRNFRPSNWACGDEPANRRRCAKIGAHELAGRGLSFRVGKGRLVLGFATGEREDVDLSVGEAGCQFQLAAHGAHHVGQRAEVYMSVRCSIFETALWSMLSLLASCSRVIRCASGSSARGSARTIFPAAGCLQT